MNIQEDYVRLTLRLPPEVHNALNALARRNSRSQNGELIAILEETAKRAGILLDPAMGTGEMSKLAVENVEAVYRKYENAPSRELEMALAKKFKALGKLDQILVMELIDRLAA